jgi:hypothetical protein
MNKGGGARDWARGKPCTLRLPGCDGGGETSVLAHIRRAQTAGVGTKPPDLCAVIACHSCHDVLDGRKPCPSWSPEDVLDGLLRTLVQVSEDFELRGKV